MSLIIYPVKCFVWKHILWNFLLHDGYPHHQRCSQPHSSAQGQPTAAWGAGQGLLPSCAAGLRSQEQSWGTSRHRGPAAQNRHYLVLLRKCLPTSALGKSGLNLTVCVNFGTAGLGVSSDHDCLVPWQGGRPLGMELCCGNYPWINIHYK